jgi:hypothetical protein
MHNPVSLNSPCAEMSTFQMAQVSSSGNIPFAYQIFLLSRFLRMSRITDNLASENFKQH